MNISKKIFHVRPPNERNRLRKFSPNFRNVFTGSETFLLTIGKTIQINACKINKSLFVFVLSARPGRPPKRSSLASVPDALEKLKKSRLDAADYAYSPARLMGRSTSPCPQLPLLLAYLPTRHDKKD